MSTLFELKEWIEKGGKVRRKNLDEGLYLEKSSSSLKSLIEDGGFDWTELLLDDWQKVEESHTRWKPENKMSYYLVNDESGSGVRQHAWMDGSTDRHLYDSYNCFKTREEAEKARDLWLAERELRSLADGGYWTIIYSIDIECFLADIHSYIGNGYQFSTEEKAKAAIKQLGEDKLKLIFGVK